MAQVERLSLRREPAAAPYVALRQLLIEARGSAGLTQAQLAERLGRPQSFVAKYEVGERSIDVVEFVAVAYILQIDAPLIIRAIEAAIRSSIASGRHR